MIETTTAKPTEIDFLALHKKAHEAGHKAATARIPQIMTVTDGTRLWAESEGLCGFAEVCFKGNTAWARWAKSIKLAEKRFGGGFSIWISDYGQSYERKDAYAEAYAKVLKTNGIHAYAVSRLD